jgi:probable rRNA maturation factor
MPASVATSTGVRSPISKTVVARRADAMLNALGLADRELSILLCSDAVIRDLNRRWRKKNRPTDVLAFAQLEARVPNDRALGDIAISIDTARKQAGAANRSVAAEVTYLLAHGLLHLVGYDHRTREEERRMNARADLLVAAAAGRDRAKPRAAATLP